jgi:NhaA family Na+:H+ antiporter
MSNVDYHEEAVYLLNRTALETISPLDRLESKLHPWLTFLIMPIFALANAGVKINFSQVYDPITIAVATGLILGKPLGIFSFSWIAVMFGLAKLPKALNWRIMFGAGCLAGIGFTMSLFIAGLALPNGQLAAGKIGTLIGSSSSAILGLGLLYFFLNEHRAAN